MILTLCPNSNPRSKFRITGANPRYGGASDVDRPQGACKLFRLSGASCSHHHYTTVMNYLSGTDKKKKKFHFLHSLKSTEYYNFRNPQ